MSNLSDPPSGGKPFVCSEAGFVTLLLDDGNMQSLMRKSKPHRLELGYTRAMMGFLLFNPQPRHIVAIGLGGGSIPKHCYRHLCKTRITAVEVNPDVIALRDRFQIPPDNERFEVVCGDGAAFVAGMEESMDALLVDGFDADGQVPQLCTQQFYDEAYAHLGDNGIMVVNILGADEHLETYISRIRQSFGGQVVVSKSEDCDNRIAFAVKGQAFRLPEEILLARAQELGASQQLNFSHVLSQIIQSRV